MPPLSRAEREGTKPLGEGSRAFPSRGNSGIGSRRDSGSTPAAAAAAAPLAFSRVEEKAARRTQQWTSKREQFEEKMRLERADREREDNEEEQRASERGRGEIRSRKTLRRGIPGGGKEDEADGEAVGELSRWGERFAQEQEWL